MRVRSMVGLIPLFACLTLEDEVIQKLPDFKKRLNWFLKNRQDLAKQVKKRTTNIVGNSFHEKFHKSIYVGWFNCGDRLTLLTL